MQFATAQAADFPVPKWLLSVRSRFWGSGKADRESPCLFRLISHAESCNRMKKTCAVAAFPMTA
jgi:hypothetical protein